MTAPLIRDAHAGDAGALADLWNPWITDSTITFNDQPKSPADIVALIAERQAVGHAFLLAEADGAVLGFASYAQFRAGPGYRHSMEHTVILSPASQGRGLGRSLMLGVEDHARRAGHRLMMAGVTGENPKGRDFHLTMGYRMMGQIPEAGFKFGRHIDLWLLGKLL